MLFVLNVLLLVSNYPKYTNETPYINFCFSRQKPILTKFLCSRKSIKLGIFYALWIRFHIGKRDICQHINLHRTQNFPWARICDECKRRRNSKPMHNLQIKFLSFGIHEPFLKKTNGPFACQMKSIPHPNRYS